MKKALILLLFLTVTCLASYAPSPVCEHNHTGEITNFGPPPHLNPATGYQCYGYGVYVRGRIWKCSVCGGAYDGG